MRVSSFSSALGSRIESEVIRVRHPQLLCLCLTHLSFLGLFPSCSSLPQRTLGSVPA